MNGFTFIEVLLVIITLILAVGVGYYVYASNKVNDSLKKTTSSTEQTKPVEQKSTETTPDKKYLVINEWGVKIPLTEATGSATYRMENGYAYLDVDVAGDSSGECKNQAVLNKVTNPNENAENWREKPSELDQVGSKINGIYYFIEGSSAACSENETVQLQASKVRESWVSQGKLIVAK